MILEIRGTSGSGKSTLARLILDEMIQDKEPVFVEGRKNPLYYKGKLHDGRNIFVLGHYESKCGGCDTIPNFKMMYDTAAELDAKSLANLVVMEGLLLSGATKQEGILLNKGHDMVAITLTTPLDVCIASVQARRDERGDNRPLNPDNTISKHSAAESGHKRLLEYGADAYMMSRDEATAYIWDVVGGQT